MRSGKKRPSWTLVWTIYLPYDYLKWILPGCCAECLPFVPRDPSLPFLPVLCPGRLSCTWGLLAQGFFTLWFLVAFGQNHWWEMGGRRKERGEYLFTQLSLSPRWLWLGCFHFQRALLVSFQWCFLCSQVPWLIEIIPLASLGLEVGRGLLLVIGFL